MMIEAWAIFESGKIDVNTVHSRAPESAMVNWLCTKHTIILTNNWTDPAIKKKFNEIVAKFNSDAKVVRVTIELIQERNSEKKKNPKSNEKRKRRLVHQ